MRASSGIAKRTRICYHLQRASAADTCATRRFDVSEHRVDVGGIAAQR